MVMGWRVHHSGCCGILKFGDAIVRQKPDFSDLFFENSWFFRGIKRHVSKLQSFGKIKIKHQTSLANCLDELLDIAMDM